MTMYKRYFSRISLIVLFMISIMLSSSAKADTPVNSINFADPNFKRCIEESPNYRWKAEDFYELTCINKNITSIAGIEHFVNLRHLDLSNNQISDLSPLTTPANGNNPHETTAANLYTLVLSNNNISQFVIAVPPDYAFEYLRVLDLSYNALTDISFLQNTFDILEELLLTHNSIESIDFLGHARNLKKLDLSHNNISHIYSGQISFFPRLEFLSLAYNQISNHFDLPVINRYQSAYNGATGTLLLNNNLFDQLPNFGGEPFSSFDHIDILDISNNPNLTGISNLIDVRHTSNSPLEYIKSLNLSASNNINCDDLNRISIGLQNDSEFIQPSSCQGPVMQLNFDALGINDLDLKECIVERFSQNEKWQSINDVETLICDNSGFRNVPYNNIEGINSFNNLTALHLEGYYLNDIRPLIGLNKLERLTLESDELNDISPISFLPNLNEFSFNGNALNNISAIINHSNLDAFMTIDLHNTNSIYCSQLDILENQLSTETQLLVHPNNYACIEDNRLIQDLQFTDQNLHSCVINNASLNGWTKVNQMWQLVCINEGINDLTGLNALDSLLVIHMPGNNISDLSPISSVTSLLGINLESNQISDISSLSALHSLSTLWMTHNQISDLSIVSDLSNLDTVSFAANNLSDISPFFTNPNLNEFVVLALNANNSISCEQLDYLDSLLPEDVLYRPDQCLP